MRRFLAGAALTAGLVGCGGTTEPAATEPAAPICGVEAAEAGFVGDKVTLVASHERLNELQLISWPDSLVGFATKPDDGTVYGYGFGENGDVMRATFAEDGNSITDAIRTPMGPDRANWWGSGGPVYYDEANGILLMVTHHEEENLENAPFFAHVTLRMAVSKDWGVSWTNLGTIIDTEETVETDAEHALAMGNGGFVIHEEGGVPYFYVYHHDVMKDHGTPQSGHVNLAVSRAPVDDVIAAALAGETPVFHKYDGSGWTEPGIGGRSADLMAGYNAYGVVGDIDPFWMPEANRYVAFYPSQVRGDVNPPLWNLLQSWSEDGIHWTPASVVYPEPLVGGDPIYTGVRAHNRVIEGCTPTLYRLWVTDTSSRWEFSTLERVDLHVDTATPYVPGG